MKKIIAASALTAQLFFCGSALGEIGAPTGLYWTDEGLLITDDQYNVLWRENEQEVVALAGKILAVDAKGWALNGYHDAKAQQALLASPYAVVPIWQGYAVSDSDNHAIRYLSRDKVTTLAGGNPADLVNGLMTAASFHTPKGLCALKDVLYVADSGNHALRAISANGNVTTYSGGKAGFADGLLATARFQNPQDICQENGVLYVADGGNHAIREIKNGRVTTIAGNGVAGYVDGALAIARFNNPTAVLVEDGVIYVADSGNHAIRQIKNGVVDTLLKAEDGQNYPANPTGLAIKGHLLYVADGEAGEIYTIDLARTPAVILPQWAESPYYYGIKTAQEAGWLTFAADDLDMPLSRMAWAEGLAKLYQSRYPLAVIDGEKVFTDLDAAQNKIAAWAVAQGLIKNIGDVFAPDSLLSKGELAVSIEAFADIFGYQGSIKANPIDLVINPEERWAGESLRYCYSYGFMLNDASITKAQGADILVRLNENR